MSYFLTVFSLLKFKSLGVPHGENSDFDTCKEVEKYEKIIIEGSKKLFKVVLLSV